MNQSPLVPNPTDLCSLIFIGELLSQNIRPPRNVERGTYEPDRQPKYVRTLKTSYPNNECWFNCLDYSTREGTKPVFGWAIWKVDPALYVAQHHAVVDTGDGLLDVTLGEKYAEVLFVPDNAAPFDFDGLRYPCSFEVRDGNYSWTSLIHSAKDFSIARILPCTDGLPRLLKIIEAARAKNVV